MGPQPGNGGLIHISDICAVHAFRPMRPEQRVLTTVADLYGIAMSVLAHASLAATSPKRT
jgi:hypothetical protein